MLRGVFCRGLFALFLTNLIAIPFIAQAKSNEAFTPGSSSPDNQIGVSIAEKYFTKAIKVRVIRLCNDDGSDPGNISQYQVEKGIEEANKVLYENSGANVLYYLDPETDFSQCIHDTLANYDCRLNPQYFPGKAQMEITADDLADLTQADLNQDGEYNSYDVQQLCDTGQQGIRRKNIAYDHVGSLVVFVRGLEARRRVKFDKGLGHWVFVYPSGGYSSCAGNLVVMNSGYWGNLLAHEAGHYLCTPHTFGRTPKDKQNTAEQIEAVIQKYSLDPNDEATVLNTTYDADTGQVDFLGDHRILDTPPDPNSTLWKSEFGDDLCLAQNDHITVNVPAYNAGYDLRPDRSLVMSYFKGCTNLEQHFSPDQVDRIQLALSVHRRHLVDQDVVECYDSKYDATDWTGMDPASAAYLKDHYLNQCQSKPDMRAILEIAHKKLFPKPVPTPDWSDPVKRIFLRDLEDREIQEEIEIDTAPQSLQSLKGSWVNPQGGLN